MKVIYEFSEKHVEELHGLFQTAWWAKGRTLEDTKSCVLGSQICVGLANQKNVLVGFTRVLTDFTFKAFIFDVIVCENQRGNGYGSRLLALVKSHEKLKDIKHFELYCAPEMHDFYAKHGFNAELGEIVLMRHINA